MGLCNGATGALKMQDRKTQDQMSGPENEGQVKQRLITIFVISLLV